MSDPRSHSYRLLEGFNPLKTWDDLTNGGMDTEETIMELARLAAEHGQRSGPNSEAKIRADEARQILFALDRYGPASDYGPPIQERIELHERPATGDTVK